MTTDASRGDAPAMAICGYCAESIPTNVAICPLCRSDLTQPVTARIAGSRTEDSALARMMLPVGRSIWAIAAGYMGLLSVMLFPAPVALVLGIIAVLDIRRHPHLHGMGRAIFAIVMGTLGSLVLLVAVLMSL